MRDKPVLESPYACSRGFARYHAGLLRKELNARGRVRVRQRVWPEGDLYRWAVYIEDEP